MRTRRLVALGAGVALLGGCYQMMEGRNLELTRATRTDSLDVTGPRVDPRTRTGAVESAGSAPELAQNRAPALSSEPNEPERQQSDEGLGIGGSGPPGH